MRREDEPSFPLVIHKRIIFWYPPPSMQSSIFWDFHLDVASVWRWTRSSRPPPRRWIGQRKLGYMYQHAKHIPRHKGETVKKHNGRNYNVCKWGGNKNSILLPAACQLRRAHRRLASHRDGSSRAAVTSKRFSPWKVFFCLIKTLRCLNEGSLSQWHMETEHTHPYSC